MCRPAGPDCPQPSRPEGRGPQGRGLAPMLMPRAQTSLGRANGRKWGHGTAMARRERVLPTGAGAGPPFGLETPFDHDHWTLEGRLGAGDREALAGNLLLWEPRQRWGSRCSAHAWPWLQAEECGCRGVPGEGLGEGPQPAALAGPRPPGEGSRRPRPPPPLPPSPRGESRPPVAETRRHSLCWRSHSADVCGTL